MATPCASSSFSVLSDTAHMRLSVALLVLGAALPARAQRAQIKGPRCAEADSIPALKKGARAYVDRQFDTRDSSTSIVVIARGQARFLARAKIQGRQWKGAMPVDLTV